MAQRRMRIGVVGANGGTDRWGARAHLPAIAAFFHPHFGEAVSLHRTLEAVVRSSATGHWEAVA